MTANELADELENVGMEQKHYDTMQQAATMLRQQQAEIEAAEQQVLDAFERGKMFGYAQGLRSTLSLRTSNVK